MVNELVTYLPESLCIICGATGEGFEVGGNLRVCPDDLLTVARARAGNRNTAAPPRKNGKSHGKRSRSSESSTETPAAQSTSGSASAASAPAAAELWNERAPVNS